MISTRRWGIIAGSDSPSARTRKAATVSPLATGSRSTSASYPRRAPRRRGIPLRRGRRRPGRGVELSGCRGAPARGHPVGPARRRDRRPGRKRHPVRLPCQGDGLAPRPVCAPLASGRAGRAGTGRHDRVDVRCSGDHVRRPGPRRADAGGISSTAEEHEGHQDKHRTHHSTLRTGHSTLLRSYR